MSVLMNQDSRFISWMGECANHCVLHSLEGEEALSHPYRWLAKFTSVGAVNAASWLGKEVTCRIGNDKQCRYVQGVVTQLDRQHQPDGVEYFQAVIEPRLFLMKQHKKLRVFQSISVPDLVVSLLKEHQITDIKLSLGDEYPEQEYFIQYQESDFDFISRLLESAGISYFFIHKKDKHEIVLADHVKAWPEANIAALPSITASETDNRGGVLSWATSSSAGCPPPEQPDNFGEASVAKLNHLEANGEADLNRQNQQRAVRHQQREGKEQRYTGELASFWMCCGEHFELTGHPSANGKYGIRKMLLSANSNLQSSNQFSCSVEAWSLDHAIRPDFITAIPSIAGMLTAVVVGPDSEEIHTDEFGRIKIQFPWDNENKHDESSSCWIRVAQPWAGGSFGALFLPRIGSEVLVSFIQGHPDHPIVTGTVYSNTNLLPVVLPDKKTLSGFVSRSSQDGEINEGHRILFDDKKNEEILIVGSQKDLQLNVINDAETIIGNEVKTTIGGRRTSEITEGNDSLTLKNGSSELTVEQGDLSQLVKQGGYRLSLDNGHYQLKVKGDQLVNLESGEQKTQIVGGGSQLKADKECVIESSKGITFKVGANEIAITSSGITLKGVKITLEGQAEVGVKGAKIDVKATALVSIDGALIKLG